jgi:hypothetical protein
MPITTNQPGQPAYGSAEHARLITFGRHPGVQTAMAWLAFSHLPENLQNLSRIIYDAAVALVQRVSADSAELTTALNTLVEAKDWFMRAGIRSDQGVPGPVPRPATVVDPPATNWAEYAQKAVSATVAMMRDHRAAAVPLRDVQEAAMLMEEALAAVRSVVREDSREATRPIRDEPQA